MQQNISIFRCNQMHNNYKEDEFAMRLIITHIYAVNPENI